MRIALILIGAMGWALTMPYTGFAQDWWKPYTTPATERAGVFEFVAKPTLTYLDHDRYELTFAVKGYCDVTVGIIDDKGRVIRHLGSGVLGSNAPAPFQKNSLKQILYWDGKDDLERYCKEPEKLRVRVRLGLKPEFDKRLGGSSPYGIPGLVRGIGIDEGGIYVFSAGVGTQSHVFVRKFGHDLRYKKTLVPPPANLPEEKLGGMGFVEYEPGRKSLHSPISRESIEGDGKFLPVKRFPVTMRPAFIKGRIYYSNSGGGAYRRGYTFNLDRKAYENVTSSSLFYLNPDGSTDRAGYTPRPFIRNKGILSHSNPRLVASPDGKWIYMVNAWSAAFPKAKNCSLWRWATGDLETAKLFAGQIGVPGSDSKSFHGTSDVECDFAGRIYVCDRFNQRVQILGPDGSVLRSLKTETPVWVRVHRTTGALYLMHGSRTDKGRVSRITKFSAFPELKPLFHVDGIGGEIAALDSWTTRPRLWVAQAVRPQLSEGRLGDSLRLDTLASRMVVLEERDGGFKTILDFDEKARKEDGKNGLGWWHGAMGQEVWCDPLRERVHVKKFGEHGAFCFDLPSGRLLEFVRYSGNTLDFGFDKKGYMHGHLHPVFYQRGVGRYDPEQAISKNSIREGLKTVGYREAPYDYGVKSPKGDLDGILPVQDSAGDHSKGVELGVNLRGDVAEECHIDYVPKMDDVGKASWSHGGTRGYFGSGMRTYARYLKEIEEREKKGEKVYFIRRKPGSMLVGATVWTFDATGELRKECAVTAGLNITGVQIDVDGDLYFMLNRTRLRNKKPFLAGRMGHFGGDSGTNPFMGTLVKSEGKGVQVLAQKVTGTAPIPLESPPTRAPELRGAKSDYWVQGAKWFYAGASPTPTWKRCPCRRTFGYTDWYKRSFVPEAYRHSVGVVDTNGNLILHMGRYGNLDSGDGAKSKIPVGGDDIALTMNRYVSATDNYVVLDDNAERIVVVKLNYHAEETVAITAK